MPKDPNTCSLRVEQKGWKTYKASKIDQEQIKARSRDQDSRKTPASTQGHDHQGKTCLFD